MKRQGPHRKKAAGVQDHGRGHHCMSRRRKKRTGGPAAFATQEADSVGLYPGKNLGSPKWHGMAKGEKPREKDEDCATNGMMTVPWRIRDGRTPRPGFL
jgi:hypothetical protein